MKQQKENPLFAKQLNVDFAALKGIDIARATTWSQIEMQCAIHGIEITYDLFKVFLMSAGLFANMFKIMLKCIEKTDFLTEFAGNDEIADIIYCMSNPEFHMAEMFNDICGAFGDSYKNAHDIPETNVIYNDWDYENHWVDMHASVKRMYKMMNAFDKRFPLMFIKFFNRNKKSLFMNDKEFVNWLLKRTQMKAKRCPQIFGRVYDALVKEKESLQNSSMFMS